MPFLTHLILDLDDTLLDTSGLLVPQAHREAVAAMMAAGLKGDFDALLAERLALAQQVAPDTLAQAQAALHGAGRAVAEAGFSAYFERDVGPLSLEPGVEEALRDMMAQGRRLILVTSGAEATQRQKVEALGLGFLDEIHYVPVGGIEVKEAAFRSILERLGVEAARTVAIGDRLDSEILAAHRLGMWSIWMKRGEHLRRGARGDRAEGDVPFDATIESPEEIPFAIRYIEGSVYPGDRR